MLEKLFKSKTTVRLLELLLFGKPLHIRELARRAGITPTYVKKELETLASLGIVSNRRVGNLSIWEVNRRSPIFEELKRIFLKTESLGSYLSVIFKKADLLFALIYGSFAKGTEGEGSDLDLLLVGGIDEKILIKAISAAERKVGREINYILWSTAEFEQNAKRRHHLLLNIIKNPILWIKGDEDGFRKAVG